MDKIEKLMELSVKNIVVTEKINIKISEQTLFKADGGEGLHLWESSIYLSRWCIKNHSIFKDKSVIELGSGCGLLGIVLLNYIDCSKLVLSDYLDNILDNLKRNVNLNKNNFNEKDYSKKNFEIIQLDWRKFEIKEKFDLILGTELIYKGGPLKELALLISCLLSDKGTCIISMPKKRSMTDEFKSHLDQFNLKFRDITDENDEDLKKLDVIENDKDKLFEKLNNFDVRIYEIKFN